MNLRIGENFYFINQPRMSDSRDHLAYVNSQARKFWAFLFIGRRDADGHNFKVNVSLNEGSKNGA